MQQLLCKSLAPLPGTSARAALTLAIAAVLPLFTARADQTKADNTTNLDLGASWAGGIAPTSADLAIWSGAYNTAGSLSSTFTSSTPVSWLGIQVGALSGTAATGTISIGGTGNAVAGSQVTLGTGGINLSSANQNVVLNAATVVLSGASQTWNVATGRNLRFGTTGTTSANANLDGILGTVITVTGGGVVDLNQGGAVGFADAAGFAGFNGKWIVEANTTLRGIRNGSTAFGTSTAADAITLRGGTLAVGGISGTQGNWSWNTPIALATSTDSTIDNQNFSGTGRFLKLIGAISGSGNLTFASTVAATMNADNGFILAGTNPLSGNVTINSNAFVRLGGLGGTDSTAGAGATGDLGTATVANNGTLTLSRTNTWTFANTVSGIGSLRIGIPTGTGSQVVTISGANTYTGATTVNNGRLNLTGSLLSAVTVASGASFAGTGNSTSSLTMSAGSSLVLAGGATTTSLVFNGANFSGATALSFDTAPIAATVYDVVTYGLGGLTNPANLTASYRGTFSDDSLNQKYTFTASAGETREWNTTSGTWIVGGAATNWTGGDQKFFNGDNAVFNEPASASVITLSGRLAPAALTVNNATNAYTFTGTAGTNDITGGTSLIKLGPGTLTIATQQSYTGGTTVAGGVLDLTGGGGAIGAIRGTVNVASGAVLRLSAGDATGYNTDGTRIGVINLDGGTLHVNTTANQTLGSATINMTGGSITGITGSNIDLFANGSAINTLASSTTSTISVPTMNLRQNDTAFGIADGAAAVDLQVSSSLGNGTAGNHNLVKNGAGVMQLTANNTFTGNITINGGVLDVAANGLYRNSSGVAVFTNTATITINSGGTLRLKSFAYNGDGGTGGLSDYGTRRVLNGGTLEVTGTTHTSGSDFSVAAAGGTFRYNPVTASDTLTLTGNANTDIALGGTATLQTDGNLVINEVITGTGGIIKTGAQSLSLGGTNLYTGTTIVSAGSLLVTGSISGSAVTVSNGTLGGTGTVGATTVESLGTLSPGLSIGTLSVNGPLTLGGTALFEIGKSGIALSSDQAIASGTLALGGILTITASGDPLAAGDLFNLFDAPSFTGSFSTVNLPALDQGYSWDITNLSVDGTIAVIPEPASTLMMIAGFSILATARRRRR